MAELVRSYMAATEPMLSIMSVTLIVTVVVVLVGVEVERCNSDIVWGMVTDSRVQARAVC